MTAGVLCGKLSKSKLIVRSTERSEQAPYGCCPAQDSEYREQGIALEMDSQSCLQRASGAFPETRNVKGNALRDKIQFSPQQRKLTMTAQPSPPLTDLLSRPRDFFAALRALPPNNTRYLWLVLLNGLVSGLYAALSQKPIQAAMQGIPGVPGGGFGLVTAVIGSVVVILLMWLLLWGLGSLGAGKEGRAAEVFGAAFLPGLIISLILLPIMALFPLHVSVAAPNFAGLEGKELSHAIQTYSQAIQKDIGGQPLSIIGNVLGYLGMAWQFFIAWVGFGVLTGDRQKALRGALIPLVVFVLLGGAFWLVGQAATKLVGGA